MSSKSVPVPFFRVGETIPESGVYCAYHRGHRSSHEVLLLRGERFPRCNGCGNDVHFELLRAAPHVDYDENFRKRKLFEVPHPEEAPAGKKPGAA